MSVPGQVADEDPSVEEIEKQAPELARVASHTSEEAQREIAQRLADHAGELAKVTGEENDILPDAAFAFGKSALTFKDVTFSVRLPDGKPKVILEPTSGHFEPSTLVALMGPSGCGKTTLLDILAGTKTSPYDGIVLLNGRPRDKLWWPRVTSYVPQADIMPPLWTVQEAVLFNHRLKNVIPSKINEQNRVQFVDLFLKDLGLYHVKDSKIGDAQVRGISGGQKRRVTLARGYASGAQLVFADEPTSGLSSTDAEACVKTMRLFCKKFGITIIVVIHQPRIEVANLFDHLMLFTANPGRCVYNGKMREAVAYWTSVGYPPPQFANPTDHFLDLVTPGAPTSKVDIFVDYFQKNVQPEIDAVVDARVRQEGLSAMEVLEAKRQLMTRFGKVPPIKYSKFSLSFPQQVRMVFQRKLLLNCRDTKGIITEYAMAVFKAVVMGAGFLDVGSEAAQLQLGYIYMLILTTAMGGMGNISKLVDERVIMKMEVSDALYHEMAYIISVAVINTIVSVGANAVFVIIMFLFGNLEWSLFPETMFWATMAFLCFDSLFSFVAAFAKDSQTAQTQAIPFMLIFVIYNGFSITKSGCPGWLIWLIYISPAAYTIEALAIACEKKTSGMLQAQWADVNDLYEYEDNFGIALAVLLGLLLVFRIGQVWCLQKLNKIER